MLYSDLVLGFFRLGLYMIFIIVMMKIHTFPLFAIRPMFIAMRFVTRIDALLYLPPFLAEHSASHAMM